MAVAGLPALRTPLFGSGAWAVLLSATVAFVPATDAAGLARAVGRMALIDTTSRAMPPACDTLSSHVCWDASFANTLRYRRQVEGRTLKSGRVQACYGSVRYQLNRRRAGLKVWLSGDRLDASWKDVRSGYAFEAEQAVGVLGGAVWFRGRYLHAGVSLAANFGDNLDRSDEERDGDEWHPLTWLGTDTSINYALSAGVRHNGWRADYRCSRDLCAASVQRVEVLKTGNYRTFPAAVSLHSHEVHMAYTGERGEIDVEGALARSFVPNIVASKNSMSTEMEMLLRTLRMRAHIGFAVARLGLEARYDFGGGFVEGYDNDLKYALLDSIEIDHAGGNLNASFDHGIDCSLFGDYLKAYGPFGRLDFGPFFSWSVFLPTVYRVRDVHFEGWEAGGLVSKRFELGRCNTVDLGLTFSRIQASCHYSYLKRIVLVLVPVYTDSTNVDLLDWRGFDASLRLGYTLRLGRVACTLAATQHVPIEQSTDGRKSGSQSGERSTRVGGGTFYECRLRLAL